MPIRSMTSFASAERNGPDGALSCELRAVNHRFLELGLRLPEELRTLERPCASGSPSAWGARQASTWACGCARPRAGTRCSSTGDDRAAGTAGAGAAWALSDAQVELTELLQYPGLLAGRGVDAERLQAQALSLLDEVLDGFLRAREREGGKLATVILERVDAIERIAGEVRGLVPAIRAGQRQKLEARLADLPQPVEPGRLEQELVLALQKLDVDEELDRLDSHVAELRRVLRQDAPAGRRLDFLLQEFNREANTLGSKSVDARTSAAAVELKVLIDQVREQVQNIE